MSYKGEIEFILHLHTFKNIQIERQGFAAVRAQIFDNSAPNGNVALPYNIVPYIKSKKHHEPAQIDDHAFNSSTIRIQYQDEKYELNNIIQFKLMIESLPKLQVKELYIKLTLLFRTLHSYSDSFVIGDDSVEEIVLKLQNIETGLFNYYETQFTQNYASSVSFSLFAMITHFKLYPYSMRQQMISQSQKQRKKEKERQKINEFQQLLDWSGKYVKNCKSPLLYFYNTYLKTLRYNTYVLRSRVNEFLKNKKQIQLKLPKFFKENQVADGKQFFQFFTNFDGNGVDLKCFKLQNYELHEQNFFFVQEVSKWMQGGFFDVKKIKTQFKKFMDAQHHSRMIKDVIYGHPVINTSDAERTLKMTEKIRKQVRQQDQYPIMKHQFQQKSEEYIFYEVAYSKSLVGIEIQKFKQRELNFGYDERNMLIVMCHGFQGSSYDMKIIQRGVKEVLPYAEFLVSRANQFDTELDIGQMGFKLAKEIQNYIIKENMDKKQIILNFVGHSMGGIIARASLKHLKHFQKQFGFFCTLATPHLGYLNGADGMIKAGLWVMRKMKQTKSLDQLSMKDSEKYENSFLFHLSKEGSLEKFKKIILISSAQDSYVPWHSARISFYKSKNSSSKLEAEMVNNILGDSTVHRVDVNFSVKKNDIDGIIGRKAHINLITNDSIFKLINTVLPRLLDLREI